MALRGQRVEPFVRDENRGDRTDLGEVLKGEKKLRGEERGIEGSERRMVKMLKRI